MWDVKKRTTKTKQIFLLFSENKLRNHNVVQNVKKGRIFERSIIRRTTIDKFKSSNAQWWNLFTLFIKA